MGKRPRDAHEKMRLAAMMVEDLNDVIPGPKVESVLTMPADNSGKVYLVMWHGAVRRRADITESIFRGGDDDFHEVILENFKSIRAEVTP